MLDTRSLIKKYIGKNWWAIKENANMGFSYQNLRQKISGEAIKDFWLNEVYDEEIRRTYKNGLFHIHNLSDYCVYCVGWSLGDLLKMGFIGERGKQSSSPPKHFSSALGQAVNFLYTTQNEAAGAQAFSSFDTYMAPFIKYDDLSFDEVKQKLQEARYYWNTNTRQGNQSPFTNITLDQRPQKHFEDRIVLRGGKPTGDTYADFEDELKMFNKAWWELVIQGDGDGRPQPWPIETLNVTDRFDWDDETLFRAVALRGSPYIANFLNSDMKPEDAFSMCCRLRINLKELAKKGGGLFGSGEKTGSIGVVTINLPLLGYLAKNEDNFFELLDYTMNIGKRSLELKRNEIEALMTSGFYPYNKIYLQSTFDQHKKWWFNHFSTIGIVGMNECLLNLLGKDILDKDAREFGLKIMDHMLDKLISFQEETGNSYNYEATPAESTSYTLAIADKERYPDIITSGNKDGYYYTNSSNIPNIARLSLGELVHHQNDFLKRYTGGSVLHIWNGEESSWWEGVSKMLKGVCQSSEIPYLTYTPTTSICPSHGLISGEHWTCPICNEECEVWSRITGYFAEVTRWNPGKRVEFSERAHYNIPK